LVPQPQAEWRLRLISPRPSSSGGAFCFKSPLTAVTNLDPEWLPLLEFAKVAGFKPEVVRALVKNDYVEGVVVSKAGGQVVIPPAVATAFQER
jgi:hypothetical protein